MNYSPNSKIRIQAAAAHIDDSALRVLLTQIMTNEQLEGEIEQHTEWLKIHDEAIS